MDRLNEFRVIGHIGVNVIGMTGMVAGIVMAGMIVTVAVTQHIAITVMAVMTAMMIAGMMGVGAGVVISEPAHKTTRFV